MLAFFLFCVGSLTFIGCLEEGMMGDRSLLILKSVMDGISSIFLASAIGISLLWVALILLVFQSLLTAFGITGWPVYFGFRSQANKWSRWGLYHCIGTDFSKHPGVALIGVFTRIGFF